MAYSQAQLDASVRNGQRLMAKAPPTRVLAGDGAVEFRVPRMLYDNATVHHGESMKDDGYWKDMARLNPWIVPRREGAARVSLAARHRGPVTAFNRFGRVAERWRWNDQAGRMERVA